MEVGGAHEVIPWWGIGTLGVACIYGIWVGMRPDVALRHYRRSWFALASMTPPPEIFRGVGVVMAVLCGLLALFGVLARVRGA